MGPACVSQRQDVGHDVCSGVRAGARVYEAVPGAPRGEPQASAEIRAQGDREVDGHPRGAAEESGKQVGEDLGGMDSHLGRGDRNIIVDQLEWILEENNESGGGARCINPTIWTVSYPNRGDHGHVRGGRPFEVLEDLGLERKGIEGQVGKPGRDLD